MRICCLAFLNGRTLLCFLFFLLVLKPGTGSAQEDKILTGRVVDEIGVGIIGASVIIKGTTTGTNTDMAGKFSLKLPADKAVLVVTYVGYEDREVPVALPTNQNMEITLKAVSKSEDDVVVVAYGKQKKESVVSAITTVNPSSLKVPSSNLTTAFAGRLAGVIAYQRSGEPGLDNAEFFIRGITSFSSSGKQNPLILIDGIEMEPNDLARINVDDIASFSIMKDANAAALYGARGANGVILVTTKEGKVDKLAFNFRAEQSNSYNSELVKLADPITYMKLRNEAVRTRDAMVMLPYSPTKIRETELGTNPILYPSVDWYDYLIKNKAVNRRANLNMTGGGQTVLYYLAANYQKDQGIIKESPENLIKNNINIDRFQLRSNVTIKFTPFTTAIVRAYGSFDDLSGPASGGAAVFQDARNAVPVEFLPYYPPDSANAFTKHILFGNNQERSLKNPAATLASNFMQQKKSMMLLQLEMEHKFNGALKGATLKGIYNVTRKASYEQSRGYNPFYYIPATTIDGSYQLTPLNPDGGTEYLSYSPGNRTVGAIQYGEVRLGYNKTLNDVHDINVTLVETIRSASQVVKERLSDGTRITDNQQLQASLPQRNISSAGRVAYGYDSRYFLEFNYGYNGSERFAQKNRWGFFPSVGAGWVVSNETFMQNAKEVISTLKISGTYGKVGNDQIGGTSRKDDDLISNVVDRFFYLPQVDMNGAGYWFGYNRAYRSGVTIGRYANDLITWEIAKKTNLRLELGLFRNFTLITDFFAETRENVLQERADIPTTMGLRVIPWANVGVAQGKGFETEIKYDKNFQSGFWLLVNGTFTYASSKYKKYEEPDYSNTPWRSRVGLKLSQPMGLIAERLFIDEEEVQNSPRQLFGEYGAGDIKYKDINGDGQIDFDDMVPIGYPTVPEIIYGGGFTAGYKSFDLSLFFQGSARSSFFIDPEKITPFVNQGQRGVLQYIADDYWSENNRNINAFWPRLSEYVIQNNGQPSKNVYSTHWLRDGSFVRLKSAEFGYTLPDRLSKKARVDKFRLYLSGTNLLLWSKFKMWDPEMAGNGLGYPVQRVINFGLSATF
ncbi:TonB-dependent receptor [Niabella sp. CC-SYL272]|uniref:SusC/RagA family TonB-linked outer membrane protein n=1 Tax=Niabella agricola TaxID=2891571 RepID=UPI001F1F63A3|nr:TonB-dependent receptor [Niabella agricola]MCF3108747.1 TonB-dependent receptor [Niabella agricola]